MAEKKETAKAAEEKVTKSVEEIKEAAPAAEAVKEEAPKAEAPKEEAPKAAKKPAARKTTTKKAAAKTTKAAKKEDSEKKEEAPKAAKKTTTRKTTAKKAAAKADPEKAPAKKTTKKAAAKKEEAPAAEEKVAAVNPVAEKIKAGAGPVIEEVKAEAPKDEAPAEEIKAEAPAVEKAPEAAPLPEPRRSIAFIGSECYPFVKTGGLGDVMYALPKALVAQNCDVKVILSRYKCIPQKYQEKMVYRGAFHMDLCADGRTYYVGIMEYVWDGVVYDFIDNEEFFSVGKPYTNLIDDIPKYCYLAKLLLRPSIIWTGSRM